VDLLNLWITDLRMTLGSSGGLAAMRAAALLVVGVIAARVAGVAIVRALGGRLGMHRTQIVRRILGYLIVVVFAVSALHQLGFELGVLLGAAGIFSVAIGFASQTAASNLVSGLFLIVEGPFEIGEVIRIGETTGEVLTIDLLSVTLRTFDNLLVRIPNESVMKAQVTNLTRFPVRRFDLCVSVHYRHDLDDVEAVLKAVAEANPLCLDEPKALFIVLGFGDSGVEIQFSVWALREQFLAMRNSMHRDVKRALEDANIEIPYPHRQLVTEG
jgi:small-conductance mechanosensitive channel